MLITQKLDHVWITVWCPSFWNKPRGESLLSLSTVENWVLVNYGGSNRDDLTMTEISRVRGGVALHETFHHSVVATPKSKDSERACAADYLLMVYFLMVQANV